MSSRPDLRFVVAATLCVLVWGGRSALASAQEEPDEPPSAEAGEPPADGAEAEEEAPEPRAPEADAPPASDAPASDAPPTSETDPVADEPVADEPVADEPIADEPPSQPTEGALAPSEPDPSAEAAPAETGAAAESESGWAGEAADPTAPPQPPAGPPPEGTGEPITERRARPDLDGVPEPGITPEDALLWIPRILTGPLYLVTEFVVRRPLGWLITELEQTDLFGLAQEIFLFADNKIGLFPTAFFDFGFVPSFGLYFFWDQFLFEENRLSMHGGTFGPDWLSFVVNDRIKFSDDVELTARFSALRRPDQIFGGIGSQASTDISRFGISQVDASLGFRARVWQRSQVQAELGYRSASFHNEGFLGNPSVGEAAVAQGRSLPDAFVSGYSAIRAGVDLRLDTRDVEGRPGAGVAVRAFGAAHGSVQGPPGFNGWFRWGGGLGGYTDILGDDRILGLEAEAGFITPVDDATVPFNELFDIGAQGPLFGFLPGMLRGRSVLAVTAAYEWPVWVFLNGRLHFSVGNVFGEHYEDIDLEDMRMSFGFGIQPTLGGELPFEVTLAFGSETFANGADITSVRFFVGARNGL